MIKLNNIFVMLLVALVGLSVTACSSDDDLNTDQYGNDIAVNSFGPCPVLRGGMLYFYGSHLDQISEIDLPGADPITAIQVLTAGSHSKISIEVPAEKCDTGIVVLKTVKGGTISTISPVTYREDIKLTDFYVGQENNKIGAVGDIVTIKGDYLNLFHGIIFADNDTVKEDAFIAHDRYTIQVAIPEEAKTGQITLTDLASSPTEISTEDALTVTLPTVQNLTPTTLKAGATISVTGSSLTQIASVKLNGAVVADSDFIAQTATMVSFALPVKASDGEVTLVTKSGVEIPAGSITTVVPTDLAVSPSPVKNGKTITITGKDLDLITGIAFPNATDATIATQSATQITAKIPVTAQEGDITLSLANGKTVSVAYTLVKPTVINFIPTTLTAGDRVVLTGTDLDLVKSITFPGEADIEITEFAAQSETAIGLTTPVAASGSGVILNLMNGTTVKVSGLTINASTTPAVNSTEVEGTVGEYVTVSGKNFNNVEAIYIGGTKVTKIRSRSDSEITFQIPASIAPATYDFIFITPEETKFTVGKIIVNSAEKTIWTGSFDCANWAGNQDLAWGGYDWSTVKAGQVLTFYFTADDTSASWVCISVRQGDKWSNLPNAQIDLTGSSTVATYTLTETALNQLVNNGGLVVTGKDVTITKITLK